MEVFECIDGFLCDRDRPCGEVNSDGDELFEEISNEEINDELLRLQEQLTEALKPRVCRWNTNDPPKDGWYRVTMDATPRYIGEAEWIRGGWAWAEADVLAWKPLSTPWEG